MSFIPHKTANASPPKRGRPPKKTAVTPAKQIAEASVELRFTSMLRQRNDFAIEGLAASGEPSLALYRWHGSHWKYIHPETARAVALAWLEKHAPKDYTASRADACVATATTAQMQSATAVSTLEASRGRRVIVPLQDKYLELVDGQWHVLDPDPKLGMTYAVPAHVDPNKIAGGIYTPATTVPATSKFGGFLTRFLPEQEDQDKLAEFAAASLIPGGVEHAFLLLGGGANGKSTFLHILEAFHPTTHTALRLEHLGRPFGLASIPGKSLAIAWEMPPFIGGEAEQVMKSLISRDTVQVEHKHKDPISVTPRATLYIAANTPPHFTDHTYGLERKIEAFAFKQTIQASERDPDYARKITGDPTELAVVLDWMLTGVARLTQRGGFAEKTQSQQELTETIKLEGDSVYAYLKNEIIVLPDDAYTKHWFAKKEAVYTAYRTTVLDSGQKPVAAPQFWRAMKSRITASGQELIEVRGGNRSERTRQVNIAIGDNVPPAENWIANQRKPITPPNPIDPATSDFSDLPF